MILIRGQQPYQIGRHSNVHFENFCKALHTCLWIRNILWIETWCCISHCLPATVLNYARQCLL